MTVTNQFPYQSFTANGINSNFALGFYVDNKEHFTVRKNGNLLSKDDYIYNVSSNTISINIPLIAGDVIEVGRQTTSERATTYSSYDNSFRPEVLNDDLDKLWLKLQELEVIDYLQKLYFQDLHDHQQQYIQEKNEQIQLNIDNLNTYTNILHTTQQEYIDSIKSYSDIQNGTLRNELLALLDIHDIQITDLDRVVEHLGIRLNLLATSSILGVKIYSNIAEGIANTKERRDFYCPFNTKFNIC
ncbi:hypothetical protein [Acinetobacter pittii]|uniref:Uncharacterized protein n=1 Tax=Acinetobacter pittii TaxID=48296 RepID=A0A6H0G022_ACIPI|nr:hypothetical protein [Acinetobacter pittii]QIT19975.1 hypothetical protein G8E09_19380 [Acinetobacter pittii]